MVNCLDLFYDDYFHFQIVGMSYYHYINTTTYTQLSGGFNRELVKDGLVVELSDGIRKIRRVFLFHDVLVCSKQKPSR